MDRSELAKLKQQQSAATVNKTDVNVTNVTPSAAANVDTQDIHIKGVQQGQRAIRDHAQLTHLDYESSGHTGFAGIKFGTTAEWNAQALTYRPEQGMIIVYTDYEVVPSDRGPITCANYKVGNGNVYLADLPFVDAGLRYELNNHIHNNVIHITQEEREFWNNKINCIDTEISDDLLIFTRD